LRTQFCKNVCPGAKTAVPLHRQNQTNGSDKDNKHNKTNTLKIEVGA
jgi:hypothetical protein